MKGVSKRWINVIKDSFVKLDIFEIVQEIFDTFVDMCKDISLDHLIISSSVFLYIFTWFAYKSLYRKGGL